MAEKSNTTAAWDNPLMPNARLRQIYLAMMQARTLAQALPGRQRSTIGLEASLVSPTIDLMPGDLVSDVLAGAVIDFLRGGLPAHKRLKRRLAADCGAAASLPGKPRSAERIWTALGAAAALQSLSGAAKPAVGASGQQGIVVLYLLPAELPLAQLKKALSFARDGKLPLLFVFLRALHPPGLAFSPAKAKVDKLSELARQCGVPAIPADADDAVAIYRVAQESIGHARSGGGPALIECIPFAPAGRQTRSAPAADGIGVLEQYMLPRKVVSRAWIDREAKTFAIRLAKDKATSK